jgi:hypothetical protein
MYLKFMYLLAICNVAKMGNVKVLDSSSIAEVSALLRYDATSLVTDIKTMQWSHHQKGQDVLLAHFDS